MKATAKLFAGSLAIVVGLKASFLSATLLPHAAGVILGNAVLSQVDARDEVLQWLKEARIAIQSGDLDKAETLIARAEKTDARFGLFHLGDTPKKARRDLNIARNNARAEKRPSERFDPLGVLAKEADDHATTDPFLERGDEAAQIPNSDPTLPSLSDPTVGMPRPPAGTFANPLGNRPPEAVAENQKPLPTMNESAAAPGAGATSGIQFPTAKGANRRVLSDAALLAARQALAVGDIKTAAKHLEVAKGLGVAYEFHEDSTAKVEAAVRKYEDVIERKSGRQQTEGWRRQYAEVLMEQAEALGRWKEFDEAERLALDAGGMGVSYSPFETNPQTLLERLRKDRAEYAVPKRLPAVDAGPALAKSGDQNESKKIQAQTLAQQARSALKAGEFERAESLIQQALRLEVPDTSYAPDEDRPWLVALEIQRGRQSGGVVTAGGVADDGTAAKQSFYDQNRDETYSMPATATIPPPPQAPPVAGEVVPAQLERAAPEQLLPPPSDVVGGEAGNEATRLFQQGQQALRDQNKETALRLFRAAYAQRDQLDPYVQQRLQDHLQMLSVGGGGQAAEGEQSLLESAASRQQLLARQLSAELAKAQSEVRKIRDQDPKRALQILNESRAKIVDSGVEPTTRAALVRRAELSIAELERFIEDNGVQIDLDARNRDILSEVERRRWAKVEVQEKLAELVDQFNKLNDEERYEEAELVAKRAMEIAPDEPVSLQIWRQARFIRREMNNRRLSDDKEEAVFATFNSVEESAVPFDDSKPYVYPDAKVWESLSTNRAKRRTDGRTRRTERELEIERKLKTPVSLRFHERPLAEVMDHLARLTGVNVHLDPRGLAEEGVTSGTPITIALNNEISLKSALNLILEPLHLSYVIKDEVLKITSEQMRDVEVYTSTYNVADLVIPIPNFVPGEHLGLQGQINQAYSAMGYSNLGGGASPLAVVAGANGQRGTAAINPQVMAQMQQGLNMGGPSSPFMGPTAGPGGLGGAAAADFDSLIELITATIQPNSWDEVGGPGSVKEFQTNLSLVISQTQDVHEEIVDLLEQLRRLQDLQVTIEVRFIRLNDSFFERIGVDFDFNIEDGTTLAQGFVDGNGDPVDQGTALGTFDRFDPSATVGLDPATGDFTADLDIPFVQESFGLAQPGFGNPDQVASFGFAILSDIEAFFVVNAAQGDRRSNILQAPKVTLFNGQQAFVSDTSQTPFVISVIPVVGDFAAAQQPVIVVLSEGTFLTIQAVVSNDRRYVRLTVVPFFSQIGDVEEFTFEGSSSTTAASSESGDDQDPDAVPDRSQSATQSRQGTTVQLPTFAFVTVTTTVSVPDGGTVLLGGIKRLSEARNEFGVPLLSKIPYVNRLFRNVGIGRDSESLMMMVTPRIIIQEEEEERLGISAP